MGCTRSKIQPLICEKEEEEYLWKGNQRCVKIQMLMSSRQSGTNIGLLNIDTKENSNYGGSTCSASSWIVGEIPEMILGILVFLFVCWFWIKYAAYKRNAGIRQAVIGGQQMSLPTVSGNVISRRNHEFLDK